MLLAFLRTLVYFLNELFISQNIGVIFLMTVCLIQ